MVRKFSDEIEENANTLLVGTLQKMFIEAGRKLKVYTYNKEKGIDFNFEIESREEKPVTLAMFFLQNKGVDEKIKPLEKGPEKGKISFKLDDVRQVNYFCNELDQPMIITVCDLESKTIYWEPIQLSSGVYLKNVHDILQKVANKNRKGKSIQIYFNPNKTLLKKGQPVAENFSIFLNDIEKSKKYLTARNFQQVNRRDDEENDVIEVDNTLPIIDQLHNYLKVRFEEILLLPAKFWAYDYPFKTSDRAYFIYDQFCIQTDNEELWNFLSSLRIHKDNSLEFMDTRFIHNVNAYEEKTRFILRTLTRNLVFYVEYVYGSGRVDIRYIEPAERNCLKSFYDKLILSKTLEKLDETSEDIEVLSRQGYINYQLGFFINAAKCFLAVHSKATQMGHPLRAIIARYNLSKLHRFIKYSFSGEEANPALVKELEKTGSLLDFDLLNMENNRSVARWIKENRFFLEFQYEIEQAHFKLKDYYFSQLWGGRSSNAYTNELYTNHAILENFLSRNFIIYDYFSEFTQLTEMYIESLFSSYAVHNSMYSRLSHFNDWIVTVLIFHGDAEWINKYCNRYFVKSIQYERSATVNGFMDLVGNFFKDEQLKSVFENKQMEEPFYFQQKYTKFLSNILVLATYMDLPARDVNEFVILLKQYMTWQKQMKYHRTVKYIFSFFEKKGAQLEMAVIVDFFYFFFDCEYLHDEEYLSRLAEIFNKKNDGITFTPVLREQIEAIQGASCPLCHRQHDPTMWVPFYRIVDNDSDRDYVRQKITSILNQNFNWRLYYLAAIFEILGVENSFFQSFISIQKPKEFRPFSHFSKDELNRDYRLGAIINLCFKYHIDTSEVRFNHLRGYDSYYDWLLDMEHFNYDHFNPRWVSENVTKYYFEKMKKLPVVREKILAYIQQHHDPLLKDNFIAMYGDVNQD
jgi:hypothetical protein